jgi:hypothetical protein
MSPLATIYGPVPGDGRRSATIGKTQEIATAMLRASGRGGGHLPIRLGDWLMCRTNGRGRLRCTTFLMSLRQNLD